jgi:phosphatidylserine/phosphatidylglycerophosphate/cardiolipin synthase-like enzyme
MKVLIAIVVLVLVAGAAATWFDVQGRAGGQAPVSAEAVFSPRGGAMRAVAREIDAAKTSVRLAARVVASDQVAKALAQAHRRGVKVEAVLDAKAGAAAANALYDAGVAVYLDRQHEALVGATVVIDDATAIVSALDLADAAENADAGALMIAHAPAVAAKCAENWRVHLAHAESLETVPANAAAPPPASDPAPQPAPEAPSASPFKTTHRQAQ